MSAALWSQSRKFLRDSSISWYPRPRRCLSAGRRAPAIDTAGMCRYRFGGKTYLETFRMFPTIAEIVFVYHRARFLFQNIGKYRDVLIVYRVVEIGVFHIVMTSARNELMEMTVMSSHRGLYDIMPSQEPSTMTRRQMGGSRSFRVILS